jgi:hypothetical protein
MGAKGFSLFDSAHFSGNLPHALKMAYGSRQQAGTTSKAALGLLKHGK